MKYQWLDEQKTCDDLSQELGFPIKSITRGEIIVGYEEDLNEAGKPVTIPVTLPGVEIEFTKEPGSEVLARLDAIMGNLRRAGGMTVPDELAALKTRVKQVEDQLKEARG